MDDGVADETGVPELVKAVDVDVVVLVVGAIEDVNAVLCLCDMALLARATCASPIVPQVV